MPSSMEGGPARAVQIWIEPDRARRAAQLGQEDLPATPATAISSTLASGIAGDGGCVADP